MGNDAFTASINSTTPSIHEIRMPQIPSLPSFPPGRTRVRSSAGTTNSRTCSSSRASCIRRSRKLSPVNLQNGSVVFRNLGGAKFEELIEEAGLGVAAPHGSRGCAFGDFDNDGDMDMLVVNMNEPPSLLKNDVTGAGHWLKVQLEGVKPNRSAIGARVTARYGGNVQASRTVGRLLTTYRYLYPPPASAADTCTLTTGVIRFLTSA